MPNLVESKQKRITTQEAAADLMISENQFQRLVIKLSMAPVHIEQFRVRGRGLKARYYWSIRDVGVLKRTKLYKACLERAKKNHEKLDIIRAENENTLEEARKTRKQNRIDQNRLLSEVYPQPNDAIDETCHVMLSLDCMVKVTSRCKDSSYKLESRLIQNLCVIGDTESVAEHTQVAESIYWEGDLEGYNGSSLKIRSSTSTFASTVRFISATRPKEG